MSRNINEIGRTGYSKTRQRQLLLDIIREVNGHIDAKDLFRRALERDRFISPATVYRSLNLFNELGLIDRRRLGSAQCYYEVKYGPEHQHLVCQYCGRVVEFACPLKEVLDKVKQEHCFTVTRAEVYLEGYCSECSEERTGTEPPDRQVHGRTEG